jgi:bifunctional non-homologous end joining protein LigD
VHEQDALRYAGKVGTGFSEETQRNLLARMKRVEVKKAPLDVPRAEARGAHWIKPVLVAEIEYGSITAGGIVRHASYLGLRADKPAREVVAEAPAPGGDADGVVISHPERILFSKTGVTKGDVADYYRVIAPLIEPWITNRPISLVRCPQGPAKKCFFQKHDSGSFGNHVLPVPIEEGSGEVEEYLYFDSPAGAVACVQMGTIEFHGWGAQVRDVEKPDRIVFDLDPDVGLDFAAVKKAAQELRQLLSDIGLRTFPLLTGGKGLHIVVPLKPQAEWPEVEDFAKRFAQALAEARPERYTANLSKAHRKGRIFIDYLRNKRGATAIVPYSVRAREGAPVAAPIHWDELGEIDDGAHFTVRSVDELLKRAKKRALAGWGEADQTLPDI